jgi:glycosyltransferase involved in cell wall biosynthesis
VADWDVREVCNLLTADISIITPTVPPRADLLARAVKSVALQKLQPVAHLIETDFAHEGSAIVRNRALDRVSTEWVAFLDDDDELLPHHLRVLHGWAERLCVDVVYPKCRIVRDGQELPMCPEWAGRPDMPFDPDILRQRSYIPVTSLVRTELAQKVGGFSYPEGSGYDDWGMYLKLLDAGARFMHCPVLTWVWHLGSQNSSGDPARIPW